MESIKEIKKKHFKESFKNVFEWVAIIATIIGLAITFLFNFTGYGDKCSELLETFKWSFSGVILLLFGILVLAIFFAYKNGRLLDEKKNYQELEKNIATNKVKQKLVCSMLHNINHEARTVLCTTAELLLYLNSDSEYGFVEKIDKEELASIDASIDKQVKNFFSDVVNNVKNMFDILTGDETSVSIKLFSSAVDSENNRESVLVTTFKRDSVSKRSRRHIDATMPTYKVENNSAFREMINSNARSYYYCNDLQGNKDYDNSNSNWRKFYNACLVSALGNSVIVKKETPLGIEEKEHYTVVGALCVDNFKGNFDDNITHDILASISDILVSVLYQYNNTQDVIDNLKQTK